MSKNNLIDKNELISLIEEHKKCVCCDNKLINEVYGMAHDHIIGLVNLLAEKKGGE